MGMEAKAVTLDVVVKDSILQLYGWGLHVSLTLLSVTVNQNFGKYHLLCGWNTGCLMSLSFTAKKKLNKDIYDSQVQEEI